MMQRDTRLGVIPSGPSRECDVQLPVTVTTELLAILEEVML